MQNKFSLVGAALLVAGLVSGCAGPEQKLGRGLNNLYEPVRLADMRRSVEQTAVYDAGNSSYATGVVRGLSKTFARFGVGFYEIVTSPFPNHKDGDYGPIATNYLTPKPAYPDSYKPALIDDSVFATDTSIGFSGGDIAPYIPGSRFRVFDAP
ncbi:MAG: exosortase system-associated protein, TIGR04073 family [Verrucomicrobiota bacterium]|jgi:putative exosortase-associated protein (TIGR04073 family)|nr:exosortase system-associated protein, TIGR04073 family [Verrucomicrobiota bacterium]MCC6822929.1 exosortase system-associated protein, TIGR04073 family [Limisphaerales bacterium]